MSKPPPDAAAFSAEEQQAARTLAEHLPPGYTADLVSEDNEGQEDGRDADKTTEAPEQGDSPSSPASGSGEAQSESPSRPPPPPQASSSTSSALSGRGRRRTPAGGGDEGEGEGEVVSSLKLQGGDVHRSLFRMAEAPSRAQLLQQRPMSPSSLNQQQQQQPQQLLHQPSPSPRRPVSHHRRAATAYEPYTPSDAGSGAGGGGGGGNGGGEDHDGAVDDDANDQHETMPVRDMLAPQGFRRDFLQQRIRQRLQEEERAEREQQRLRRHATMQRRRSLLHERRRSSFGAARLPITRNFVEFLELYGHFADEDLESSDGESKEGEEGEEEEEEEGEVEEERDLERRPLIERRATEESTKKKAGMAQSFFTLLKAFVGTGIMFLPKAYNNGGLVFSTVTLLVVSLLSMAGFHLLLQCRRRYGGGYGDIGLAVAGPRMRGLILGSIALSQLGFVCAGIVFGAENLASFAAAVAAAHTRGSSAGGGGELVPPVAPVVSTNLLIVLEVALLVPLAFVRDIARLGPAALLGDICIAIGLAYMYSADLAAVASRGWRAHETVRLWFNPSGYALTVGAAIFTFEGIGLILPIQSSMAQPQRFGWLLVAVMLLITAMYVSVGALGYAAFGVYTKTEVIDNYPHDSALVQAVQCLYALAVLAGMPVQLFPAVRIIEGKLFGGGGGSSSATSGPHHPTGQHFGGGGRPALAYRSGKRDPRVKWAKNGLRAALCVACGAVALLGAGRLDQFVALIGSLACVPLLFIYPPYLHYRGLAGEASPLIRAGDVALMVVGFVAMVYTTAVTLANNF